MDYISLFLNASLVVQIIIVILIFTSIYSWSIIIEKLFTVSKEYKLLKKFELFYVRMRSSDDVTLRNLFSQSEVYSDLEVYKNFKKGRDFIMEHEKQSVNALDLQKIMEQGFNLKLGYFENKIDTLGIIASITPYLGLLGTIFGVLKTFSSIAGVGSVNLTSVIPGISEALLTTAIGFFVAIPASLFYSKFTGRINYIHDFAMTFFADVSQMIANRVHSANNAILNNNQTMNSQTYDRFMKNTV